jgi:hypothetical protein
LLISRVALTLKYMKYDAPALDSLLRLVTGLNRIEVQERDIAHVDLTHRGGTSISIEERAFGQSSKGRR